MSDERLRALERRFQETGTVADEVAWLNERVRVGQVDVERLRLAAYLEREGARRALGDEAPAPAPWRAVELVRGLKPYGPEAFNRAGLVALGLVEPRRSRLEQAVASWIACPCEARAATVGLAAREVHFGEWDPSSSTGALLAVARACAASRRVRRRPRAEDLLGGLVGRCGGRRRCRDVTSRVADPDAVRAAIVGALLRWTLA